MAPVCPNDPLSAPQYIPVCPSAPQYIPITLLAFPNISQYVPVTIPVPPVETDTTNTKLCKNGYFIILTSLFITL